MIEALISRTFATRNAAHVQHWKTDSFSKHEALGEFYEALMPALDKLVETQMGAFGQLQDIAEDNEKIVEALQSDVVWLTDNRKKVSGDLAVLENIVDELTALYLKTIFKLERLK